MSTIIAEVARIDKMREHPDADNLEIAVIGGATVAVLKDTYQRWDKVVYFPPNLLIPEAVSVELGVHNYLKHATYPGDTGKSKCRVGACRLRGIPSYGFCIPYEGDADLGTDVSATYGAVKYEPPLRTTMEDMASDLEKFHRYTNIQNYHKYPRLFQDGDYVRITEKIHGANCRVGLVNVDGEFQFMAGSNTVRRKKPEGDRKSQYWMPLETLPVLNVLSHLCDEENDVIIFGEIFGPTVQDMDYGVKPEELGFRAFDISVNGKYLPWSEVIEVAEYYDLELVPLLYEGPYYVGLIEQYTDGPSMFESRGKFKGREGVVVTALDEKPDYYGRRKILKSVSCDYLDRKNAQDNGE